MSAKSALMHRETAPVFENPAQTNVPLVRPVWWLAPRDEDALLCGDQYPAGNDLLVAPVIEAGA